MVTSLLWINQAVFIFFLTIFFQIFTSSVITIILLAQCSGKKPDVKEQKEKVETKKEDEPKLIQKEKVKMEQDKGGKESEENKAVPEQQKVPVAEDAEKEKEKEHVKETEEKRTEEIKPKIMKRNAKEERIARGKETRGKGDYPTMDDVLSDWDSEKDGKKKKDDDDQKSKGATTNLEDVDETKKNEEQKIAENEEKK